MFARWVRLASGNGTVVRVTLSLSAPSEWASHRTACTGSRTRARGDTVLSQINAALPALGQQAAETGRQLDQHRDLATHVPLLVAGIASQATDTLLHANRLNRY